MTLAHSVASEIEPCAKTREEIEALGDACAEAAGCLFPRNPMDVARELGATIIDGKLSCGLPELQIDGEGDFIIRLPRWSEPESNQWMVAQSIGHYILHSRFGKVPMVLAWQEKPKAVRWDAMCFAAGFMMPEARFRFVESGMTPTKMAEYFGVREPVIATRIKVLRTGK